MSSPAIHHILIQQREAELRAVQRRAHPRTEGAPGRTLRRVAAALSLRRNPRFDGITFEDRVRYADSRPA